MNIKTQDPNIKCGPYHHADLNKSTPKPHFLDTWYF